MIKKNKQFLCFQAKTIDFDVNFLNFEDPAVLERLTGPDYEKFWKESYGFDNVSRNEGDKVLGKFPRHCVESEYR
jgi:hypothetical protein